MLVFLHVAFGRVFSVKCTPSFLNLCLLGALSAYDKRLHALPQKVMNVSVDCCIQPNPETKTRTCRTSRQNATVYTFHSPRRLQKSFLRSNDLEKRSFLQHGEPPLPESPALCDHADKILLHPTLCEKSRLGMYTQCQEVLPGIFQQGLC